MMKNKQFNKFIERLGCLFVGHSFNKEQSELILTMIIPCIVASGVKFK